MGSSILQAILGGVSGGASGLTAVREQRRLEEEQRQKAEEAKRQAERQAMLDRVGLVEKGFVPESSAGAMDMPGAAPRTPFMSQVLSSGERMVMEQSPQMRTHEAATRKAVTERGIARAGEERAAQQFQAYYDSLSPEQQERFGPALRGAQAGIPANVMQQMLPRDTGMSDYQREQIRLGEERLRLQRQQAGAARTTGEVNWQTLTDPETGNLLQLNPRTGETRPVVGAGGQPVLGAAGTRATEGERKASAFLTQAEAANTIIDDVISGGKKVPSLVERTTSAIFPSATPYVSSKEYERMERAGLRLADAWLRFTSGAAVPEPEVRRQAMAFMPQPGEGEQTLREKQAARQLIIESLQQAAGRARPKTAVPQDTVRRPPLSDFLR
jgi:hypothetical protein